jgi:4-hydroxybenzoyl-CoA thioesterase
VTDPDHVIEIPVSFGDCDPAGIVFYPNYFRWFDRCFHDLLQVRGGGHRALCARLGSAGLGLMDAGAMFRAPVREGETIRLELRVEHWGARSVRVGYAGRLDETLCVEGHELRGVFLMKDGRMTAGPTALLREALGL